MENKITIKDFWNSEYKIAIHCKTEEEANELLKAFDKFGEKWCSEESYLEHNYWNKNKENTCYDNMNRFSFIKYYKSHYYKIYEFDEVDLDN